MKNMEELIRFRPSVRENPEFAWDYASTLRCVKSFDKAAEAFTLFLQLNDRHPCCFTQLNPEAAEYYREVSKQAVVPTDLERMSNIDCSAISYRFHDTFLCR